MHAEQLKVVEHAEHAEIAERAEQAEQKNSDRRTSAERQIFRHSITMNHLQQGRLHHTKVLKRLPDAHIYSCILVQLYTHMHSRSVLLCFGKYQNTQAFYSCVLWKYQNMFYLCSIKQIYLLSLHALQHPPQYFFPSPPFFFACALLYSFSVSVPHLQI